MVRRPRPNLTLLALLAAAGFLSAGEGLRPVSRELLASIRNQEPTRAVQITRSLESEKFSLGLGMLDGLRDYNKITDAYGGTHVRYHQTYRGIEVYGGVVLGHMDASGSLLAPHATVHKGISLETAALLSEAQILEIVKKDLPQEGRLWPMRAKPLVFPTQYQDGLKIIRNGEGNLVIDGRYSVGTPRKSDPYRWAFQVSATQSTPNGLVSTNYVIDGLTGEILKKDDGLHYADTPSVGTGNSQYNGTVNLNTLQLTDSTGLFTLRDTTRATKPWPDPQQLGFPEYGEVGIQTWCYSSSGASNASGTLPFTNATNSWGDGQAFVWDNDQPGELTTSRGQTAAVDAHYGIQCAWDYYANVLGRNGGIDGLGGSPITLVHYSQNGYSAWSNAAWSPALFMMVVGDDPVLGPLSCMDIMVHELSHGVMSYTANLEHSDESDGLNEANSDVHATMAKYYFWGADGKGTTVPSTTTKAPGGHNTWDYMWTMGAQLSLDGSTPLRWLYKPSKDGYSYDAWFDGIGTDDAHYSMGPGIRAFYFLSQGSSSDSSQDTYSNFLPKGMNGIGNDAAIRIWYHAMTTKVTDINTDYHGLRDAMIASAAELFPPPSGGGDSAEMAAVKNAFAAINVGGAEGGPEPVRVSMPSVPGSRFTPSTLLIVPQLVPVALAPATVANATDKSITWSLGGLSARYLAGGNLGAGDVFTAPITVYGGTWPLKATSRQDPKEFAVRAVVAYDLDCDSDSAVDACDLGALALSYSLANPPYRAADLRGTGVGNITLAVFLEGFRNAFTH